MPEDSSEGSQHAVQNLTTVLALCAGLFGALSALISITETPELAYNGGPMGFALATMSVVMVLYIADVGRRYDV